jgi:hypothetical protein
MTVYISLGGNGRLGSSACRLWKFFNLLHIPCEGLAPGDEFRHAWHCHVLEHEDNEMMPPTKSSSEAPRQVVILSGVSRRIPTSSTTLCRIKALYPVFPRDLRGKDFAFPSHQNPPHPAQHPLS